MTRDSCRGEVENMPEREGQQPTELHRHISTLANLEEAAEPVVSCYLDLETGYRETLNERVRSLESNLDRHLRVSFWEALGRIEVFVGTGIRPESRGAAVFSRGGERAFFLPLQFRVALPTRVTVSAVPHIYHLIELRQDRTDHFVRPSGTETCRAEEDESLAMVETFHKEMRTSGLAVGGTLASFKNLKEGRAGALLLSRSYAPDPGWFCRACGAVQVGHQTPPECASCRGRVLRELNLKEEVVRIAEQQNRPIRILEHSDGMKAIGGIGCLLVCPGTERFDRPAA